MKHGRWEISGYDRDRAVCLVKWGVNPLLAVLLSSRKFNDEKIQVLLGREERKVYDPFLFEDMHRAVDRIKTALNAGEKIAVYGDYDADGITSACLLTDYLRSKGADCTLYIPDRIEEGYGLHRDAVEKLSLMGTGLIITVDCGITAVEETEYAKSLGVDVIITDHHQCGECIPEVPAINPKRPDCAYPEKSLAGVGVAFKLICAIEGPENTDKLLDEYSDIVAIGTIADVMDVTDENRTFIQRGLEKIRSGGRVGITALCQAAGLDLSKINSNAVGYIIAPKINAAGRIGDTKAAVDLILSKSMAKAQEYAEQLCALNRQRQVLEGDMFRQAVEMIEKQPENPGPIILSSEQWHQGIAGIVASRLAEKYHRPAVVICVKDGVGRGSCRSFGSFDLFKAIEAASMYLENYGGHTSAAGITVDSRNIDNFKEKFTDYYMEHSGGEEITVYNIDFEVIKPGLLTLENLEALRELEPYGNGNPVPMLCIIGARVMNVMSLSGGKHTKIKIAKNGEIFESICFGRSPEELQVSCGGTADIAFQPQINEYRGKKSVQLLLTDIFVYNNSGESEV